MRQASPEHRHPLSRLRVRELPANEVPTGGGGLELVRFLTPKGVAAVLAVVAVLGVGQSRPSQSAQGSQGGKVLLHGENGPVGDG